MPGVERSSKIVGESRVLEGVRRGFRELGYRAGSPTKRNSFPTPTGSD